MTLTWSAVLLIVCWGSVLPSQAQTPAEWDCEESTPAETLTESAVQAEPADTLEEFISYVDRPVEGGLGGGFMMGFPRGPFRENVGVAMGGFSGYVGGYPPRSPTMIGLEVGYMIYGFEDHQEPFSTISNLNVDVETQHSVLSVHLLARLQPRRGWVRPYLDGLVGFHYFFTYTSVQNSDWTEEDRTIASLIDHDDVTFSHGWGGGLMIKVYDGSRKKGFKPGHNVRQALIDLRVRNLYGAEALYIKEGGIHRATSSVTYDLNRSRTDMITAFIGLVYEF